MIIKHSAEIKPPSPTPSQVIQWAFQDFLRQRRWLSQQVKTHLDVAGIRARLIRGGVRLAWSDPGNRLGVLRLWRYSYSQTDCLDKPTIFRIAVNTDFYNVPVIALKALGVHTSPSSAPEHINKKLELTITHGELAGFASWAAKWIIVRHGRHGGGLGRQIYDDAWMAMLSPPFSLRPHHGGDVRESSYIWSAAAWRASESWRERQAQREAEERRFLDRIEQRTQEYYQQLRHPTFVRRLLERAANHQPTPS